MASDSSVFLRVRLGNADCGSQVYRVDVEDVDRGSDKATFVLQDPGSVSSEGIHRNMPVRIELGWETQYALAFVGAVETHRNLASTDGHQRVEVTCTDMSRLFMEPPPATGRQHLGTLQQILDAIATRHGIALGDVKVDPMPEFRDQPTGNARPPLNQGARTEWRMLQELAEEYRARAFVEVSAKPTDSQAVREAGGVPKLFFVSEQSLLDQEPMGRLLFCRGMGRLLQFDYRRVSSGSTAGAAAAVANPDSGEAETRETAPPAADTIPPPSPARTAAAAQVLGPGRAADHRAAVQNAADTAVRPAEMAVPRVAAGLPSDPQRTERLIQRDRTRLLGFVGEGTAMGTVFLRAKGCVEIDGIASWAAGRWYVSRVNHIVERTRRSARDREPRLSYRTTLVASR